MTTTTVTASPDQPRRKGLMDQIISGFVDGALVPFIEIGGAFIVFALIWGAFAYALIASQGSIDQAWQAIRGLPLVVQGLIWLLFLPVMVGMWIWETTWPIVLRVLLVAGLGAWNLMIFLPKWLTARP